MFTTVMKSCASDDAVPGITVEGANALDDQSITHGGVSSLHGAISGETALCGAEDIAPERHPSTLLRGRADDSWESGADFTIEVNGQLATGNDRAAGSHASAASEYFSSSADWSIAVNGVQLTFIPGDQDGSACEMTTSSPNPFQGRA